MKRSTDRILSTHVGSLPRPTSILTALEDYRRSGGSENTQIRDGIRECIKKQIEIGLDVVNDGEYSKPSFIFYIHDRLSGFEPDTAPTTNSAFADSKETRAFPEFYKASGVPPAIRMVCTGPIKYTGQSQLASDVRLFKEASSGLDFTEAFMPSISPTNVAAIYRNAFYTSEDEYNIALANAMREEYRAIVDAGFVLQIDDPHLMTHYVKVPDMSVEEARKWASHRVDMLNYALDGIPAHRVRFHTCAGINIGPRVSDMPLPTMIDIILRIRVGGYSFEYGNPRHEHEWSAWKNAGLPDDKVLIPGFISNSTALVEHPELVAQRIMRFADVVGRERVIAGADCGFASTAKNEDFPASVVWAKLESLAEGARLASKQLWSR